jgi:hypothetical protein
MSRLFLSFFVFCSQLNLLQLSGYLGLSIGQPTSFNLQLCLTFSTYGTAGPAFPSLSTFDFNFLYLHTHHIPLKYVP